MNSKTITRTSRAVFSFLSVSIVFSSLPTGTVQAATLDATYNDANASTVSIFELIVFAVGNCFGVSSVAQTAQTLVAHYGI